MYENLDPQKLDKIINRLGKKTTVYFIGFCVFFLMSFFYSISLHVFFTVLIAMLFMGFLLVYYMQTYVFVRILRLLQFNDNFLQDMLNNEDETKDIKPSIKDREKIPEI